MAFGRALAQAPAHSDGVSCPVLVKQLSNETFQCLFGILAKAAVYRRDLNNRAAGRDQPVKALALTEFRDGPGGRVPFADVGECFQVRSNHLNVDFRPERLQSPFVGMNASFEEPLLQTKKNHAGVDEFFALNAGNDTNDSVIKRVLLGHEWPPGRSLTKRSAAGPAS